MQREQARAVLINEYHSVLAVLQEQGLGYQALPDEDIERMTYAQLMYLTRRLRVIARTPGVGR